MNLFITYYIVDNALESSKNRIQNSTSNYFNHTSSKKGVLSHKDETKNPAPPPGPP